MTPKFHETVILPVTGRPQGCRVVITDVGILRSLVMFFSTGKNKLKSLAWQTKVCHAVGTLFDYMQAVPPPCDGTIQRALYLSDFVQKLMTGTIPQHGNDETGLYWHPASWGSVTEVIRYINSFSDFCVGKFGTEPINSFVPADFSQRLAQFRHLDTKNENSLLKHLGNRKQFWQDSALARAVVAPSSPKGRVGRPPFFPREHTRLLFQEGLRVRLRGEVWERYSIRDEMIAILQRFGGLREAEPFHLFVTDVIENPLNPGHAEVRLYHPEQGRFSYYSEHTHRLVHETRTEFLRTRYGRRPRNCMFGKEKAGWKNLLLDFGKPDNYAVVHWFPKVWGRIFWNLYQIYRDEVLPAGLNHPYLFVNLSNTPQRGAPYRIAAYNQNLKTAVERIGLVSLKALGTTSHGFRHAYAQDLTDAKIPDEVIQICLHQNSVLSQANYKRPSVAKMNRELNEGLERLRNAADGDSHLQRPTSQPSEEELELGFLSDWASKATAK